MLRFSQFLEEGVNDPAIFKAIFLAGGPGSGKSFMIGQTALTSLGFRLVNSDHAFEIAMKKAGEEMSPEFIGSDKGQSMRNAAKTLTGKQQELYLKGRLGVVIDGTGRDYAKISSQATQMKKLGYDVGMLFVNTNLETAKARNQARARTLPDDVVTDSWNDVQNNIGKFQSFFRQNMMIVDNSDGADWKSGTMKGFKWATKFAKQPPQNAAAIKWIASQKKGRAV